jgi:RIO kinase 2
MSAKKLAEVFKQLRTEDFRVLLAVEIGMNDCEYVPTDTIYHLSELGQDRAQYVIRRLHSLRLLRRWTGPYRGYALNYNGYDCLALNVLVKRGVLDAIGQPIGVGKESDVYDGLSPGGERMAIKFYRFGRTSFRQIKRSRAYPKRWLDWMLRSKMAAKKEFKALGLLYQHGVSVPKPIAQNRHVIVTSLIEGAPLAVYSEIPTPEKVLEEIMENVRRAYTEAGVINADLSEYNILIKPDGHVLIIDWPQFITSKHPNAFMLLERDVRNVLSYFERKFKVKMDPKEALEFLTLPG